MKSELPSYRLTALAVFTASLLLPNIAVLLGGFSGFFLTYLAWSSLLAIAVPLLMRSGRSSLSPLDSALIGMGLVITLSFLGFFLGFDVRRYPTTVESLTTSLLLFSIQTIGVEVGRSAAMGLTKHPGARVAIGTLGGLVLGRTLPVLASYFSEIRVKPLAALEDAIYSLTLSVVHEFSGLGGGILFRIVVDGYWRFSPLVLTTSTPAVLRSALLALAYYAVLEVILVYAKGLRGRSRELFEFNRFRKILKVLPEAFSITFALALLLLVLNRYVPLVVVSGSMAPTIHIGDIVFVRAGGGSDIEVGDVIAYSMEGKQIVVHRVIDIDYSGVRTKGDANPDPDPFLVDYREILGEVVFTIPKLGYIAITLQSGGSLAYLSIAMFAVVTLSLTIVRRYLKSRKLKFSLEK